MREVLVDSKGVLIGRDSSCDLIFKDSMMSRRHAFVVERPGCIVVIDLHSSNGTQWRHDEDLWSSISMTEVPDGSVVMMGNTILKLRIA